MGSQYINQYQGTMSGGWENMEKMVRINIWSARGGGVLLAWVFFLGS